MPGLWRAAVLMGALLGCLVLRPAKTWAQSGKRMELGGEYSFVDSNAPTGKCGCFQLNGGTGWFAYNLSSSLAVVGEAGGGYASNINRTSTDLTLMSFLAGPRYSRHLGNRMAPFVQVLIGGAHASGALTPLTSGLAGSANSFAMTAGGGMDLELARHWALRLVQLDYYLTRFNNGVNGHQNSLRVGVGIAFRFGGAK
jgi:peptidoglycan-associated lipoprotein